MSLITPSDRFAIFGARGMAGSAIGRALERAGYQQQLTSRSELNLLDPLAVQHWFGDHQPSVVVIAAAKVGGIYANTTYPADFLLDNLKIQNNVIETAWRSGVRRLLFSWAVAVSTRNLPNSRSRRSLYLPVRSSPPMSGMPLPRLLVSSSAKPSQAAWF